MTLLSTGGDLKPCLNRACGKMFGRTLYGDGRRETAKEWQERKYCSGACVAEAQRTSESRGHFRRRRLAGDIDRRRAFAELMMAIEEIVAALADPDVARKVRARVSEARRLCGE